MQPRREGATRVRNVRDGIVVAPHAHRPQHRQQQLDRGTIRRVLGFARPHRRLITGFLVLTVIDACLVVVTPLLVKRIIDDGVLAGRHRVVVWLSLAMAATAIVAGLLTVAAGFLSSRIGEGLIYDLRTQVFAHVQRQSLAFFTRTQTGALVSPPQQRRDRRPAGLHVHAVQHRLQHRSRCWSSASR